MKRRKIVPKYKKCLKYDMPTGRICRSSASQESDRRLDLIFLAKNVSVYLEIAIAYNRSLARSDCQSWRHILTIKSCWSLYCYFHHHHHHSCRRRWTLHLFNHLSPPISCFRQNFLAFMSGLTWVNLSLPLTCLKLKTSRCYVKKSQII